MSNAGTTAGEVTMNERLATVETLVREVLRRLDADVAPRHNDHEDRIRRLEAKLWLLSGSALAGGGVLGTIASHLTGA
jgi:hypothetical protein